MPDATLYGSRQAISAGHYLAAAAGYAILEAGGNATDAGCAAGIALAVLCPFEVSAGRPDVSSLRPKFWSGVSAPALNNAARLPAPAPVVVGSESPEP